MTIQEGKPRAAAPTPAEDFLARQRKALKAFERDRQYRHQRKQEAMAQRRRKEISCQTLRQEWQWLNHGGPIYLKNPDGSRRYLDDDERQRRKAVAEERLAGCE